jgi:hypothetical protein
MPGAAFSLRRTFSEGTISYELPFPDSERKRAWPACLSAYGILNEGLAFRDTSHNIAKKHLPFPAHEKTAGAHNASAVYVLRPPCFEAAFLMCWDYGRR